jgi:hypothetical protein
MNPNNVKLDDFDLWIFASHIAMHVNEFTTDEFNLDTGFIRDGKSLRKLSRSRDVIARIITEFTSLISGKPHCRYLNSYLTAILRKDSKLYVDKKEIARIWDIPVEHLDINNLAELESKHLYGQPCYLWEDVVNFVN